MKLAVIGECMLEIANPMGTQLARNMPVNFSFGGDTLNTAIYLARLGVSVSYLTGLGRDIYSDWLLREWQEEGVDTRYVVRDSERTPGLYMIQTDAVGERTFTYWRSQSAAKHCLWNAEAMASMCNVLKGFDALYLSGITLSLMSAQSFNLLIHHLQERANSNFRLMFDSNYRPKNWPSSAVAKARYEQLFPFCDMLMPTFEDEALLFGDASVDATVHRYRQAGVQQVVVKQGEKGAWFCDKHVRCHVAANVVEKVVDSTGAGDSFNAGFLAAYVKGLSPEKALAAGHQLASVVVQHRGAVIDKIYMPTI